MKGSGVSACATCDGFFFRGKEVAVIGGGNTAVEEALYLTNHAIDVTLIHRRDTLARREDPAGPAVRQSQDQGALGQRRRRSSSGEAKPAPLVKGVRVRNVKTGAEQRARRSTARSSPSAIRPATELFKGKLALDSDGYHRSPSPARPRTDVAGVFACGDVKDKIYRQAVTAAGTGCMAALDAEKWLAGQEARLAQAAE